jgi:hypothetical protein
MPIPVNASPRNEDRQHPPGSPAAPRFADLDGRQWPELNLAAAHNGYLSRADGMLGYTAEVVSEGVAGNGRGLGGAGYVGGSGPQRV